MIVCTVLNVQPYSGLYTACNNCMGKVLQHQGSKWWCRKCDSVTCEVHQRYCIAMTITDHSTCPQKVLIFGPSCDPVFGCSATDLSRYLQTIPRECINQLLYKAIKDTLVGNCFGFVFCLPPLMKKQSNLLGITELLKKLRHKRELVVTTIKTLYNYSDTVLRKLEPDLTNTHQAIFTCTNPSDTPNHHSQHDTTVNIDTSSDSDFLETLKPSPSQRILLDTYLESQKSSCSTTTPCPQSACTQQAKTTTPILLDSSSVLRQRTNPLDPTKAAVPDTEHPSSPTQPTFVKMKNVSHSKVELSQEVVQDYLLELSRTECLVKELESDWESTQQTSTPFVNQHNTISLSEDTLRELQEPFSQSRHSTPNTTRHETHESLFSTSARSLKPHDEMSPELFASVRSIRTLIGADSSQHALSYTPSQLLQSMRRENASPELFESLPREEQNGVYCLTTPSITARDRTHALRRKLVQDPVTPHTSVIAHNNAFSPDIV